MISSSNYTRLLYNSQTRSTASHSKKREALLRQGCRGPVTHRRIVYLATPIDQFNDSKYGKVRRMIAACFTSREWAIFEPALCHWSTRDWLKAWPRLVRWIDLLVIWPRQDMTVGLGVYQEACDVDQNGKFVLVVEGDSLKTFRGFRLLRGSPFRYARVRVGKIIRLGNIPVGGL